MALLGKRRGALGIAYQADKAVPETTCNIVVPVESANIEGVPVTYERVSSISADPLGRQQSGFEYSWSFSGAELDYATVGYLLWLYGGKEEHLGAGVHILPHTSESWDYASNYFTLFKDHGGDIAASGKETEALGGCRIDTLTLEQPHKGYMKVSASGLGMSKANLDLSLSRTPSYGGVGWHDFLKTSSSGIAYRLDDATMPSTYVLQEAKSCKIEFKREIERAGRNYSSNDPSDIVEGGRSVSVEVVCDAIGGNTRLLELIDASDQAKRVGWKFAWHTSATQSMILHVPHTQITGNVKGELGTGTDPQEFTFSCDAFRYSASDELWDAVMNDGVNSAYSAR